MRKNIAISVLLVVALVMLFVSRDRKRFFTHEGVVWTTEYHITYEAAHDLGDSIQLRNDVNYWHPSPDIMNVSNNGGSFSATFDTQLNGGGAMYSAYGNASVPSGWLIPFSYIRIGRQENEDEGIAKVRLIVPHTEGQTSAASGVYPCFYELTLQKMRD